ncbi:type III secretion protein [Edwardsiella piscicida]|uniref:type III secretion protein n=1 Tax=Edwardsiella piscicida TaxID=1263550 RepID=UPI001CED064C|nr:type III secretion protein [Edwardsiella piscicida]AOP42334.2 type III secretion protein [Edwardsiella piscicida]
MLTQLRDIKRLRERGLRSTLAQLADEADGVRRRQQQLQTRLSALQIRWHTLNQQSGCLDHVALGRLRSAQSAMESESQRLRHELDALAAEQGRISQLRGEHETQPRLNLREQEKLKLLEESE